MVYHLRSALVRHRREYAVKLTVGSHSFQVGDMTAAADRTPQQSVTDVGDLDAAVARTHTHQSTAPRDVVLLAAAYRAGTLTPQRLAALPSEVRLAIKIHAASETADPVSVRPGTAIANTEPPRAFRLRTDTQQWHGPPSPVMQRLARAGYDPAQRYTEAEFRTLLEAVFPGDPESKIAARLELGR